MATTPPNPEHLPGFEILTKHKEAIRQLVNFASIPIPKLEKYYKLDYSTIRKVLHYEAPERARPSRTGRPRMLNGPQIRWIIAYVSSSWEHRILDFQHLHDELHLECSAQTLERRLKEAGYFRLGGRTIKQKVTRNLCERFCDNCIQHQFHRGGTTLVNAWKAIGYNYKSPLLFVERSGKKRAFTQKDYLSQILTPHIESILEDFGAYTHALGLEPLFIENGNSAHGHKSVHNCCAQYRTKHGIILMPHPSTSPDMNPIEKCWRWIKQSLHRRHRQPTNENEMRQFVLEEWDRIPQKWINELIDKQEHWVHVIGGKDICLYASRQEIHPYTALSHCWGSKAASLRPVRTLKADLEARQLGIMWEELSKTFQDAIFVTQQLGIRYLWIDSLCIVQDDDEDWRDQSGKLAQIYEGSHLTIAATRASNGAEGSLSTRELILATRVFHYAADEMVWECKPDTACECDGIAHPTQFQDAIYKRHFNSNFAWKDILKR
ncbi:HET-domain-containing protein [Acephala macrosclerotiorum]|nr:HET-domain-containing protein [Acephala macrosclerotiorum]